MDRMSKIRDEVDAKVDSSRQRRHAHTTSTSRSTSNARSNSQTTLQNHGNPLQDCSTVQSREEKLSEVQSREEKSSEGMSREDIERKDECQDMG